MQTIFIKEPFWYKQMFVSKKLCCQFAAALRLCYDTFYPDFSLEAKDEQGTDSLPLEITANQ